MLSASEKRLLKRASRLTLKLEQSAQESDGPGLVQNRYGHFEPRDLRDQEIEAHRILVQKFPSEAYYSYLLAASLWRACFFGEAKEIYARLSETDGQYSLSSMMMLALLIHEQGDASSAQRILDRHNRAIRAQGGIVTHESVSQFHAS